MTDGLKPCPFCGSEVELHEDSLGFLGIPVKTYEVYCTNKECICKTPIGGNQYHSRESITEAWNTRYNKGDK